MKALEVRDAVATYGVATKAKLSNPTVIGAPEDQLRAPLEDLIRSLADVAGFRSGSVVVVGETPVKNLQTRPDYAVTNDNALIGFVEVKAPGKGADPRRFREAHDKEQWQKLRGLPNLVYTDGNSFSLWRSGELARDVVRLDGEVESAGSRLTAPDTLLPLFSDFLGWAPQPPRSAAQLAEIVARLCRLLRDEVTEHLGRGSASLTNLAEDWRKLLFPSASDEAFADGYAQAVTFGLLMARAEGIRLTDGLDRVALDLRHTNSLIGAALRLLTDDIESETALKTSIKTLVRVLDVVHWPTVSKGDPEAWLYFYEQFLSVYDNELRKQTGSYYTPPEVVQTMVRLVDEALRSEDRFGLSEGLGATDVTLVDPATGTGTFILGVLRRIAEMTETDLGPGAVPSVVDAAVSRIIGFEMQFGPFSVAQLRVLAELRSLTGDSRQANETRLYVTDTLGNPYAEEEYLPQILRPLGESRRRANEVKRQEKITVVIGNPPYKEKAKGLGGWIERGSIGAGKDAPLGDWMPPRNWKVGAHAKHLRNLYVYFWRWATWKVFGDADPKRIKGRAPDRRGIISFITVAGFLNGPGFQKMRSELRRAADEIRVIDCSPEGHQPEVATRIFQGVQHPVCIVMAVRRTHESGDKPAKVWYRTLPKGDRRKKFSALQAVRLDDDGWTECSSDDRASFLPSATGSWAEFAPLEDLFEYNGSGVMPGRTWVIAPDRESLARRWDALRFESDADRKQVLFHPHLRGGKPGDKHIHKLLGRGLHRHEFRGGRVATDTQTVIQPTRYAFRSFDHQWIIPDARLINQPNPTLWALHSDEQVYMTAPHDRAPTGGPALSFAALVPDLHHYNGRGGRVFPLWGDRNRSDNVKPRLLRALTKTLGESVSGPDFMAYLAGVMAHPTYTTRFQRDLVQPGLRVPLSANPTLFEEAVEIGREVIWLHCFGERFVDTAAGRPKRPPGMPKGEGPVITRQGAIPTTPAAFPDRIAYEPSTRRLEVGEGFVDNVPPTVWGYEVSGKQVLMQWFSYRRLDRSRPIIGNRRPPSELQNIQPEAWLVEYTTELMNVLHVLGRLVALENRQSDILERICANELIGADDLRATGAFDVNERIGRQSVDERQGDLLEN